MSVVMQFDDKDKSASQNTNQRSKMLAFLAKSQNNTVHAENKRLSRIVISKI